MKNNNIKDNRIINRYMTAFAITFILLSATLYVLTNRLDIIEISYGIGDSMAPTNRDRCIDIYYRKISDIEKNEVYSFINPESGHGSTKRVVAVEGDNVKIKDGRLYINGKEDDSVFNENADYSWCEEIDITLDRGYYFMLGDNRNVSIDSRMYGPVSRGHITGKQILSIY